MDGVGTEPEICVGLRREWQRPRASVGPGNRVSSGARHTIPPEISRFQPLGSAKQRTEGFTYFVFHRFPMSWEPTVPSKRGPQGQQYCSVSIFRPDRSHLPAQA